MSLNAPDLVAQKILGSGPEGFGSGAVLPYRHEADPLGDALDRVALAKHAREKANSKDLGDNLNTLPKARKEVQETIMAKRNDLVNKLYANTQNGRLPISAANKIDVMNHTQETNGANQFFDDIDKKIAAAPQAGEFIDTPKLQNDLALEANHKAEIYKATGDPSVFSAPLETNELHPRYFSIEPFLAKKSQEWGKTVMSNDTMRNGPLGQIIYQDKDQYRFKPDQNGDISKEVTDHFLTDPTTDPTMQRFRASSKYGADQARLELAKNLRDNDPRFAGQELSEIVKHTYVPGDNSTYFDGDKYERDVLKANLKPYQSRETSHDITQGHKYDKEAKGDAEKEKVNITPTDVTIKTPVTETKDGETTISHYNEINLPGTLLQKKDKPFQLKGIVPKTIWDTNAGHVQENNVDPVNMEATHVAMGLLDNNNKIIAFKSPDEQEEFIKNLTPTQVKKYKLQPLIIGNIQEKAKIKGDTEEGEEGEETTTATNRQVAIPYKEGSTEAGMIKNISANTFKYSPQMENVQQLWNEKNKPVKKITGITPTIKIANKGGMKAY